MISKSENGTDWSYGLGNLIDIEALQGMADSHFKATGIPIGLINASDGSVLVGAGWQDICLNFHRTNPETLKRCEESDRFISAHLSEDKPCEYKCLNGLWDIGMPIVVLGQHMATLFLGQFFYEGEVPDRHFFYKQAEQYNFDKKDYLDALDCVPIFSRQKVQTILEYDVALVRFITDLAEKALLQKKEKAKRVKLEASLIQAQKLESIGNLAGGIAHDFNNILASIIGFTELALEDAEKGSNQEKNLEEVYAAGNRAKELVKQILVFSRRSEQELKPVRLSDIINDILKLLRPSTPTTIEIFTSLESDSFVMGNPSQLHQVVLNLCTNAIQAMQNNGGELGICLKDIVLSQSYGREEFSLAPGKYIELTVLDNGPGIDPEIIEKIFEPYYTTKGVGEGTGLGLAMVKGIVDSYGGTIKVKSEPRKRTKFTTLLPISTSRDNGSLTKTRSILTGTEHILFVDDEPPITIMGSRILENLGYSVTSMTSSLEALELFKEKSDEFDLVISDMTMPHMTGDLLSVEVRKIRRDIPIILCTGYSNIMNDDKAKRIGIDAFIYKPFTKSDLANTIREVLDAC